MEIFAEPYKENDSGAELRDFTTSNLKIDGKRYATVAMLKGRSIKRNMTIADCGKHGNQLLKLAKNSAANVFIIQHVNFIEEDVVEALMDHLMTHSKLNEIYVCPINGQDTARILKGLGRYLQALANKT